MSIYEINQTKKEVGKDLFTIILARSPVFQILYDRFKRPKSIFSISTAIKPVK